MHFKVRLTLQHFQNTSGIVIVVVVVTNAQFNDINHESNTIKKNRIKEKVF